jgi:hypothetical protein
LPIFPVGRTPAGHIPGTVDRIAETIEPTERAQIHHSAIAVQESTVILAICSAEASGHLPSIVDGPAEAESSAERTETNH